MTTDELLKKVMKYRFKIKDRHDGSVGTRVYETRGEAEIAIRRLVNGGRWGRRSDYIIVDIFEDASSN